MRCNSMRCELDAVQLYAMKLDAVQLYVMQLDAVQLVAATVSFACEN